jgi:hypothetical protein
MKYFDEMTVRPEDRDQIIQSVVPIVVSMDYSRLLMNNTLTFHKKILERRYLFGEFADRWEKRFEKSNVEMH